MLGVPFVSADAQNGIVFIDEIDKLKASNAQSQAVSGESVQHALLKIMEGALVRLKGERYLDTRHILFIYGGSDNQNILDRLSKRVKPTDLFEFGLIPEFTETRPFSAHRLRSLKNNACAKAGIVQISVVRSLNHALNKVTRRMARV